MVGLLFQASLCALTDATCHDLGHVLREQRDVVANADKEAGSTSVVAHLHQSLYELIAVKEHQLVVELEWNTAA